jgi:hypothetical protein
MDAHLEINDKYKRLKEIQKLKRQIEIEQDESTKMQLANQLREQCEQYEESE